jgi:hypothetical protein
MTKSTGNKPVATPERVAERIDSLIRSIRGGLGGEIAEHNAAVNEAADARLPKSDRKES